jgi:hypothetical protein
VKEMVECLECKVDVPWEYFPEHMLLHKEMFIEMGWKGRLFYWVGLISGYSKVQQEKRRVIELQKEQHVRFNH